MFAYNNNIMTIQLHLSNKRNSIVKIRKKYEAPKSCKINDIKSGLSFKRNN